MKKLRNRNILIIALLEISILFNLYGVIHTRDGLFDFGSFYASGQLYTQGENPYSIDSPWIFWLRVKDDSPEFAAPNLNPPITVLLFRLLSGFDAHQAKYVWVALNAVLMFIIIGIIHRTYPVKGIHGFIRILWAINIAGFWHILQLGQIYIVLLLLIVLVWLMLKNNKNLLAGIFLGILIALKPNMVFWAFLLLLIGNWRVFLAAGIFGALISIIPIFTDGIKIYQQWVECISIYSSDLLLLPQNNSFQGIMARFGSAHSGVIISIIFVIVIILFVLKEKPSQDQTNAISIVSSLLISPIAWAGYTIFTLPIFFSRLRWSKALWIPAGILSVSFWIPLNLINLNPFNFIVLGWFYGWGLIILIAILLLEVKKTQPIKVEST